MVAYSPTSSRCCSTLSETSGIINYIAAKEGGLDKLKGKSLVVLYHGSPYGKETIPISAAPSLTMSFCAAGAS